MTVLRALTFTREGDAARTAAPPTGSRLAPLRLYSSGDGGEVGGATTDEEGALLVLGGTFDLRAGSNSWGSRGARPDPFSGRPVAVFLPPHTEWSGSGTGELLVVGAVPPPTEPVSGREALAQKPLLPLAGSGKAFDPASGQWKTHEEFPSAPQAILPRHIERAELGGATVERVFPLAYKAHGLCVDEALVPSGATLDLRALPDRPPAVEVLVFLRPRSTATVRCGDEQAEVRGDAAFAVTLASGSLPAVTAADGPCWVVLAWAGK